MKLLMFHCSKIQPKTRWAEKNLGRGLFVLVGEEIKDTERTPYNALKEIVKTLKYSSEKRIVLAPFRNLGSKEGDATNIMEAELLKTGYSVSSFDFKDTTNLAIDVFGHRVSVAYREVS